MEKTAKSVVMPLDAGWNDVGSWSALWDVGEKDDNNVTTLSLINFVSQNHLNGNQRIDAFAAHCLQIA